MKRVKALWALPVVVCLFGLLAACGGDDDYEYPSVKLEFLTAYSDASGVLTTVCTDAGERLPVLERTSQTTITPDSLVRIVTNYEPMTAADGTSGVKLYGWAAAVASLPLPTEDFKEGVKREPASVLSSWLGYEYLNILLEVKQQGTHTLGFVEEFVTRSAGEVEVSVSLYHDVSSTVQDYTKRAYLSVPLWCYLTDTVEVLTIHFSLVDNAGETQTYTYEYIPKN